MHKQATLQGNWTSEFQPKSICSYDYEAIGQPTKALVHEAARFLYFRKGKGTMLVDGKAYPIRPCTVALITPWKITDITQVEEPLQIIKVVFDYTYLNILLKGAIGFEDDSSSLMHVITSEPICYLDSYQVQQIEFCLDQIKQEVGVESIRQEVGEAPLSLLMRANKMIELLILYHRIVLSSKGEYFPSKQESIETSILSYIYTHSSESLSLESIANTFYVSVSTLVKQINETTGTTFVDLLNRIRIEKASDYLIYTQMSLDDIALNLGFSDASHLCKHFVGRVGITPNKYRKIYCKVTSGIHQSEKELAYQITDYVYRNFTKDTLTSSETAALFHTTNAQMNRALLYYAEKNFDALLHSVRINKACQKLIHSHDSIMQIAIDVGYNNVKTFNVNFYKYKNMTPSEFRSQMTLQGKDGLEANYQKE